MLPCVSLVMKDLQYFGIPCDGDFKENMNIVDQKYQKNPGS